MADNTIIQKPSVNGATISTEDIGGGLQLPRSKIVLGVSDIDSGDVSSTNPLPIFPAPITITPSNISIVSATNTAQVVTYAAASSVTKVIGGICWSYSGTGSFLGGLTVADQNSNIVFQIDITNLGPGFIKFEPPITTGSGNGITVTLAAGGTSITGKVNVLSYWTL